MSRVKRITIYKFSELPEEVQQKVLNHYRDINMDHDWWGWTYGDAGDIGLAIDGFDDYHATGKLIAEPLEVIKLIMENHGKDCETYKLAKEYKPRFLADRIARRCIEDPEWETADEELTKEFTKQLLRLYKNMLDEEYAHLTDDEQVQDTLEANEYEFDEDGDMQ